MRCQNVHMKDMRDMTTRDMHTKHMHMKDTHRRWCQDMHRSRHK